MLQCLPGAQQQKQLTQIAAALTDQIGAQQLRYQLNLHDQYIAAQNSPDEFLKLLSGLAGTSGMRKIEETAVSSLLAGTTYLNGYEHEACQKDYVQLHVRAPYIVHT